MSEKPNIPKNIAAERAVLAGICKYGQAVWSDIVDITDAKCFTDTDNQIIFSCIKKAIEGSDNLDIPSIMSAGNALGLTQNLDTKEQREFIRSLFNYPIEQSNVRKESVKLKKLEIARRGQTLTRDIYYELAKITGTESVSDILGLLEKPLLTFGSDMDSDENDKTELLMDGMEEWVKHIEENPGCLSGIPSPFAKYNEYIGGGRRKGGVYLVASRPKQGKSTMALNDGNHVAGKLNIPVLYLDTEMTKDGQRPRMLSNLANLKIKDVEMGNFRDNSFMKTRLNETINTHKKIPLYYRKISGKPFDEILSIIRRWVTQTVGIDENGRTKDCLIIYDYFKLMSSSSIDDMEEFQALGFQIGELADFCGKYDVPCQAYVQLNRGGVTDETSSSISQSDRLLWLCSSFAILKRKTSEEILIDGVENGNTKLIPTAEQRFGPGMEEGDYINMHVDREKCIMIEGKTRSELKVNNSSGFNVVDEDGPTDEYDDSEFDKVNYGDDQYRKDSGLWQNK